MGFALELREAAFAWRRHGAPAFHGTLAVPAGTATAVFGLNGAGKSTLLRLAAGSLKPGRGQVLVFGADARSRVAQARLGFLADESPPYDRLHLRELLHYQRALYGRPRLDRAAATALIEAFGLAGLEKRPFLALSHGQRRRVELLLLRAADPELWILDEPHAGLDASGLQLLAAELLAARARGRTLLWASHAPRDLAGPVDRIIVLRAGVVDFDGDPGEALRQVRDQLWVLRGLVPETALELRAAARELGVEVAAVEPDAQAWLLRGEEPGPR
jgi:ABC-type multidrug transport system ATPase subunit